MSKQHDISQIHKYLNGELDSKAMHRLERQAQDDPFLMDALEGYGTDGRDRRASLDILTQQLNERTKIKVKRITPWASIAIAASVLGFLVVAGVLYNRDTPPTVNGQTAMVQPKSTGPSLQPGQGPVIRDKVKEPVVEVAPGKPAMVRRAYTQGSERTIAAAPLNPASAVPTIMEVPVANNTSQDTVPLEDKVMNYMAAQPDTATLHKIVATKKPSFSKSLTAEAEGVTKSTPTRATTAYDLNKLNLPGQLTGVVTNKQTGAPMPGVNVKVDDKNISPQRDANGSFALSGVKTKDKVSFGYQGYEDKKIKATGDSMHVQLNATSSSLSEVVVINNSPKLVKAHPAKGWDDLSTYLNKKAVLPVNEKTGTVWLKVTVSPNGSIKNISVSQSLSAAADSKAIDLIKAGPKWAGSSKGDDEVVSLRIDFHH